MTFLKKLVLFSALFFFSIYIYSVFQTKENISHSQLISGSQKVTKLDSLAVELSQTIDIQGLDLDSVDIANQAQTKIAIPAHNMPSEGIVDSLFSTVYPRAPWVQTVSYSSRVSWKPGRAAWISDYARHYNTSTHFISRSLSRRKWYKREDINNGDKFNVFKTDLSIDFHILIDASTKDCWLFLHDSKNSQRVLINHYKVGLGRIDSNSPSGMLTPYGTYLLGKRRATFNPSSTGLHKSKKVHMMNVFGTRWIPFDQEIGRCTHPAKGFGIHGAPFKNINDQMIEDASSIGGNESDGCIRFRQEDIEEVYAIVVSHPTYVHIVENLNNADLPGQLVEPDEEFFH